MKTGFTWVRSGKFFKQVFSFYKTPDIIDVDSVETAQGLQVSHYFFENGNWVLCTEDGKPITEKQNKHNHYFKDVSNLTHIDVYRVLDIFEVTDSALQHAAKKILVAGNRGNKDIHKDIQEAVDSLVRWQSMQVENSAKVQL